MQRPEDMAVQGRRSGRRIAALGMAFAAILAIGWALLGRDGRAAAPAYVTEPLSRGPIAAIVTATGTVNPVEDGPGRHLRLGPDPGDRRRLQLAGDARASASPRSIRAPFEVKVRRRGGERSRTRAPRVEKARADLDAEGRDARAQPRAARAGHRLAGRRSTRRRATTSRRAPQLALDEAGRPAGAGALEEARGQPRLHRHRLAGRRRRRLAQRRRRPDGRRELPDADALRDRRGPDEDAGRTPA